jgi:four helix bundle protein
MKSLDTVNAWSRASDLAIKTLATLSACDDPSLRQQTTLAALKVAAKIASRYEYRSPQQCRDQLITANGSCAELRTHLHIACELGIINNQQSVGLIQESLEISIMLRELIAWCQQKMRP